MTGSRQRDVGPQHVMLQQQWNCWFRGKGQAEQGRSKRRREVPENHREGTEACKDAEAGLTQVNTDRIAKPGQACRREHRLHPSSGKPEPARQEAEGQAKREEPAHGNCQQTGKAKQIEWRQVVTQQAAGQEWLKLRRDLSYLNTGLGMQNPKLGMQAGAAV